MGHGKISLKDRIEDKRARYSAFYKRKFGAMRKLIQLSVMCDKDVLMYIYDKETDTMLEYASERTINL